ncbi:zinc finger domain-containing protein [Streptacidiphilus carbonis]|uniref:zinc finger domain-containing protein n=1 Tax=Streptacidiphilus carbonis TaxID=105422 RepID=UPI0005AA8FFA|nr:hypothetical protein [Streptacidiphilus carbonis]
MPATITAAELNVRRVLTRHAISEHWPVTPQLLHRISKLAAAAAIAPRPADPPRGPEGGRRRSKTPPAAKGSAAVPAPVKGTVPVPPAAMLQVECTRCGASVNERCRNDYGVRAKDFHRARRTAAEALA